MRAPDHSRRWGRGLSCRGRRRSTLPREMAPPVWGPSSGESETAAATAWSGPLASAKVRKRAVLFIFSLTSSRSAKSWSYYCKWISCTATLMDVHASDQLGVGCNKKWPWSQCDTVPSLSHPSFPSCPEVVAKMGKNGLGYRFRKGSIRCKPSIGWKQHLTWMQYAGWKLFLIVKNAARYHPGQVTPSTANGA